MPFQSSFAFEGLLIHPAHGLMLEEMSAMSAEDLPSFTSLSLDTSERSPTSSYFDSPRSSVSSNFFLDPSYEDRGEPGSPTSSASSTPTKDSPLMQQSLWEAPTPPSISLPLYSPTSSSFSPKLAAPPSPRTASHPYARAPSGGTSMQRAFSTPVLTQRQMDSCLNERQAMHCAIERHSVGMARSKSSAPGFDVAVANGRAPTRVSSAPMSSSSSHHGINTELPLSRPPHLFTFEPNWGATLPPRARVAVPAPSVYPYNLRQPTTPPKFNRTQSSDHLPVRRERSGSRVSLSPLTPIIDASPEKKPTLEVPTAGGTDSPRPAGRLHRGLSFS